MRRSSACTRTATTCGAIRIYLRVINLPYGRPYRLHTVVSNSNTMTKRNDVLDQVGRRCLSTNFRIFYNVTFTRVKKQLQTFLRGL